MKLNNTPQSIIRALLIIVVGTAAVLALAYWPEQIQAPTTTVTDEQKSGLTVEWVVENGTDPVKLDCTEQSCNETAFSALLLAVEQANISMQYKTYDGLGVLVTEMAGVTNGQDGKYWVYEVNDQKVGVAADAYHLQPGDRLTWKFVIPD